MEEFLNDVANYIDGYYRSIVAVTPKLVLAILVILASWSLRAGCGCLPTAA